MSGQKKGGGDGRTAGGGGYCQARQAARGHRRVPPATSLRARGRRRPPPCARVIPRSALPRRRPRPTASGRRIGRGNERAGASRDRSDYSRENPAVRGSGEGPEMVAGRNSVVESLRAGIPAMALYVTGRAHEDERVAESVQLAAGAGIAVLESTVAELDRLTGGAIHQGVALRVRPYEYAHPEDLASERTGASVPPHRCPRRRDRPAQPGGRDPVRRRLRGDRRGGAVAAQRRRDRGRVEGVGRGARAAAGGAGGEPDAGDRGLQVTRVLRGRAGRGGQGRAPGRCRSRTARWCWSWGPRDAGYPVWSRGRATCWSGSRWPRATSRSTPEIAASIALYEIAEVRAKVPLTRGGERSAERQEHARCAAQCGLGHAEVGEADGPVEARVRAGLRSLPGVPRPAHGEPPRPD